MGPQHAVEPVLHGSQHREVGEDGTGAQKGSIGSSKAINGHRRQKEGEIAAHCGMNIQFTKLDPRTGQRHGCACGNRVFLQPR